MLRNIHLNIYAYIKQIQMLTEIDVNTDSYE